MKVFVTVGSMLPFDRLINAMDDWASQHQDVTVLAQIGAAEITPKHLQTVRMVTPAQYRQHCESADVIVSHVGMGTVITAAELGKPLVAMPRLRRLREVTSDHQEATARWLASKPGVIIVNDSETLGAGIERALSCRSDSGTPGTRTETFTQSDAQERLLAFVRAFVAA